MTSHSNLPPTWACVPAPGEAVVSPPSLPATKVTPAGTTAPDSLSGGETWWRQVRST